MSCSWNDILQWWSQGHNVTAVSQPPSQLYIGAGNVVYQCRYFCHRQTWGHCHCHSSNRRLGDLSGTSASHPPTHRSTARPCEVEPKLPPAALAEPKVPEAKAKAGKARPVPAHGSQWSQLARLLWDVRGGHTESEPTNSWQLRSAPSGFRWLDFQLQLKAVPCNCSWDFPKKINAVYEIYIDLSSMAQEQGSTRCRHPRTQHTHTNTV